VQTRTISVRGTRIIEHVSIFWGYKYDRYRGTGKGEADTVGPEEEERAPSEGETNTPHSIYNRLHIYAAPYSIHKYISSK